MAGAGRFYARCEWLNSGVAFVLVISGAYNRFKTIAAPDPRVGR